MGANSEMGKLMFDPLGKKAEAELEQRNARISTLEQQLKESTARYDKLFIRRTGGQTTQYKVDKQGKVSQSKAKQGKVRQSKAK